jgi:alpha-tubulin suppressor-like RCC1 family protein
MGAGFVSAGCGSDPVGSGFYEDDENLGEAEFELAAIPSGVGCVRITVTGTSTVTKDFTLASPASTAALNMDRLPLGTVTIDGAAYQTTCGTGSALYIADKTTALLEPGIVSKLGLTFRKNNPVSADVNFVGNVQALRAGGSSTYVVIDGLVYGWGQLPNSLVPLQVSGLTDVIDVTVGYGAACALKSNGTVWCWGDNTYGQAGVASPSPGPITTPVQAGGASETGYTSIYGNGNSVCGIKAATKETKCWGTNQYGQLGTGSSGVTFVSTPTAISMLTPGPIRAVDGSSLHTCFVTGTTKIHCTGYNGYGALGDGTTTDRTTVGLTVLTGATAVAAGVTFSCGVLGDGSAKCWGYNSSGEVGDGTTTSRYSPTSVIGVVGAVEIDAGGYFALARLSNGGLVAWGKNSNGQLGDATTTNRTTAVAVNTPAPAEKIATGSSHSCMLTTAHDVYCWGDNTYGQIGDGTYLGSMSPVKVRLP